MRKKEHLILPLFQKFISDSRKGKRLQPSGTRIKQSTINFYDFVYLHLKHIESLQKTPIKLIIPTGNNKRDLQKEVKYWKNIYSQLFDYLYNERNCHDNYISSVVKNIKAFFNYLRKDRLINVPEYVYKIQIKKSESAVLALSVEQLKFLIYDKPFEALLNDAEKTIKDIFVFGCTVALRQSDLFAIKYSNIENVNESTYLNVISKKTNSISKVKLPEYAIDILQKYKKSKTKTIFSPMSLNWFNVNLKRIAQKANWTEEIQLHKTQQGVVKKQNKQVVRLCDILSSHFMRRTAITTMIILGMNESLVRQISGHASNSKEFYRYVKYAQTYIDNEINKVHELMVV